MLNRELLLLSCRMQKRVPPLETRLAGQRMSL